jgi:hypothetical protein
MSAGELSEYVNSARCSLTNNTDSLTFDQMRNVRVFITNDVTKRRNTAGTLEKLFDLRDFAMEGEIWLTEPELVTWVGYTTQTNNSPVSKSWEAQFVAENGNTTTINGTMKVSRLNFLIQEEGAALYDFRLESVDGSVGTT